MVDMTKPWSSVLQFFKGLKCMSQSLCLRGASHPVTSTSSSRQRLLRRKSLLLQLCNRTLQTLSPKLVRNFQEYTLACVFLCQALQFEMQGPQRISTSQWRYLYVGLWSHTKCVKICITSLNKELTSQIVFLTDEKEQPWLKTRYSQPKHHFGGFQVAREILSLQFFLHEICQ